MLSSMLTTSLLVAIICLVLATTRLLTILPRFRAPPKPRKRGTPTHLLIVLGSGGHTAEMFAMLHSLDTRSYTHRTYVISDGDPISAAKARSFEQGLQHSRKSDSSGSANGHQAESLVNDNYGSYTLVTIPRARRVHQSLLTSPFTCLITLLAALSLLRGSTDLLPSTSPVPDLILTNGPATSAIVVFASILLRFFDFSSTGHARTRIIYAESFARIKTLSLSAKVVAWAVDRLLVQWEQLDGAAGGKAEYTGLLIMEGVRTVPTSSMSS